MTELHDRLALKASLPRTWPAFFERHGNFTAAQLAAIPALLGGGNALICAPTASGKTEAALAPLIERHCPPRRAAGPHILYLTPTRALANDLHERLARPLELLGLTLAIRTRDASTFRADRPADLLLTTPESLDSLLAARARLFAKLGAVVLDELHLLDGTPRGDQLRVLLSRIRRIRGYAAQRGDAPDAALQYAALSATLTEPAAVAARYFDGAQIIQIPGGRSIEAEQIALAPEDSGALPAYLATFRARGWRKALVFCNSRAEVEAYAARSRERSPFGGAVFVHYSNIEPRRRRAIERQFAESEAAICFASSTLELGIDVGDIDVVILIGPPGSPESLLQRVGRGNRRHGTTRAACCYRTTLERLLFEALIDDRPPTTDHRPPTKDQRATTTDDRPKTNDEARRARHHPTPDTHHPFRPAVAIQQIFSLIKQSRTAAVRLAELADLFAGMLAPVDIEAVLGELHQRGYLKIGRPGEWRAGERLDALFDEQASAQVVLSIHSNIQAESAALVDIRDQHTQQVIARVDALWLDREALTLEGRPFDVAWRDGEAIWVASRRGQRGEGPPVYRSARQFLSYDLARRLPERLGLELGAAPFIARPDGVLWFHWLGDLYGRAALDLLRYTTAATATSQIGLCLQLPDQPRAPPAWAEAQITRYLEDNYRTYERLLALGPFQHLLPSRLRRRAVVEQFGVARFLGAVAALRPVVAPDELAEDLIALVA
jgi:ATP-dependent Lhr-like helicase